MQTKWSTLWWDRAVLVVGLALTLGICIHFSASRIFWSDELFGWMLLRDPSLKHMLTAWRAGGDGGGILFYLLGRVWFFCFGSSEVSFRLFSAIGSYVGFASVWLAARRYYPPWVFAPVLFAVWFGTASILLHIIEGRFYGLMVGAAGLAYLTCVRVAEAKVLTRRLLISNALANAVLVGLHPLGIVYSAAFALAVVLVGLQRRQLRWIAPVSCLVGWTVLLFSREALRNSAKVGVPHFWTTRPHVRDFFLFLANHIPLMPWLFFLSILLLLVVFATRRLPPRMALQQVASALPVIVPAAMLLLVPVFIWIVSRRGTSLFTDRYLLPVGIGIVLVGTELWTLSLATARWNRPIQIVGGSLLGLLCTAATIESLIRFQSLILLPPFNFTGELMTMLPPDVPVVFERVDVFDLMLIYQPQAAMQMRYLLDWDTAMAVDSPLGDVSGFHEMENWRKLEYFSSSIQESASFLMSVREFVVVDDPHERWFERNIVGNSAWSATPIGSFRPTAGTNAARALWEARVWRVRRVSGKP